MDLEQEFMDAGLAMVTNPEPPLTPPAGLIIPEEGEK